jgi:magnesium transporter
MNPPPGDKPSDRSAGLLEVDESVVEDIAALLEAGQRGMVLNLVADLYPADVALLLTHLPFDEAQQLVHWVPPELVSETMTELDDTFRASLLEGLSEDRLTDLLDALDTDDAVDVLADLPSDLARHVLPDLEDREDITDLLDYDEESAGGLMAREFVAIPPDWTLADATEEVRRRADDVDELYAAFVVDAQGVLLGVVSLKQLLLSPADVQIRDIMDEEFISVTTDVDQEEVGRIVQRYDLVSLPVLDEGGHLMGRITIDDVVDVIREEVEEDMQKLSGVAGGEEPTDSVFRISRGRLPWLLVGLVGAGLSGVVIGSFEHTLEQAVVLASFIPIVMAMAGNVGIQSSAIAVQGLASGEVWSSDVVRRLGKELGAGLINGIVLSIVLGLAVMVIPFSDVNALWLALTASLSLLFVILIAAALGTTIPLLLHRLGIDPAIATGPFITTSNDIIGLSVFFLVAILLYL